MWVITLEISLLTPKLKTIVPFGSSGHMGENITLAWFVVFVTQIFARIPRLNHRAEFLCGLIHMVSLPGYCIPGKIKVHEVSVFPYFTTKTP